jgi:hypothetical protein
LESAEGELPFVLNLPEGCFRVDVNGLIYPLEILQGRFAVADNTESMLVGTAEELRSRLANRWDTLYKHQLRTIVRHGDEVHLSREELPTPDENQLFVAAQQHIMRHNAGDHGGPAQLEESARRALTELGAKDRAGFVVDTSVRLAADRLFPNQDVETFCRAVNVLVRLYMAMFNDFFVQEMAESLFSGTAFHGIYVATFCNGQHLDNCRHAGGRFRFILRRPWLEHTPEVIEQFRTRLESNPEPDPIALLSVRARSFLMRGGFRSALIEARASFDLCLARKIREGFLAKGKTDPEIDSILNQQDNRRLDQRAKKVLKQAVGKSAAELDQPLWKRFIAHQTRRGGVAHTAVEPSEEEATQAVDDMLRITGLIDALATEPSNASDHGGV